MRRAYDEAVTLCESLGHRVEPIAPPGIDGAALDDACLLVAAAAVAAVVENVDSCR